MSEPENNPQTISPAADPEGTNAELQRLINILFAGLILTSFTVTAFLGLQSKRAAEEAAQAKTQSEELIRAVQQEEANIQFTYGKLLDFGHKHPDFQTLILSKYRLATNAPAK